MKTEQLIAPKFDYSHNIVSIESAIYMPQEEIAFYLSNPDSPIFALEIGGTMPIELIEDNRTRYGGNAIIKGRAHSQGCEYAISYAISFPNIVVRALSRIRGAAPNAKISYTVV